MAHLQNNFLEACKSNTPDVVRNILAHGIVLSEDLKKAFKYAVSQNHVELVKILIQHGIDEKLIGSCLETAPSYDLVNVLLDAGADKNSIGLTIAFYPINGNDTETLRLLIDRFVGSNDFETVTTCSRLKACEEGKLDIVRVLTEYAHVSDQSHIKTACLYGHIDILDYLVSVENPMLLFLETYLKDSIFYGKTQIFKYLLPKCMKHKSFTMNTFGIYFSRSIEKYPDIAKLLLLHNDGTLPIEYGFEKACAVGNLEIVQACVSFLHLHNKITPRSVSDKCAFWYGIRSAVQSNHRSVVEFLLDYQKSEELYRNAIIRCIRDGNSFLVEILLEKYNKNFPEESKRSLPENPNENSYCIFFLRAVHGRRYNIARFIVGNYEIPIEKLKIHDTSSEIRKFLHNRQFKIVTDENCAICWSTTGEYCCPGKVCSAVFCEDCFDKCLQISDTCPHCRQKNIIS